jgi:hypothetical protein
LVIGDDFTAAALVIGDACAFALLLLVLFLENLDIQSGSVAPGLFPFKAGALPEG